MSFAACDRHTTRSATHPPLSQAKPERPRLLVLGLLSTLVLLLHILALDGLSGLWQRPSALQNMAVPMYTRQLKQEAAPEPPPTADASTPSAGSDRMASRTIAVAAPTQSEHSQSRRLASPAQPRLRTSSAPSEPTAARQQGSASDATDSRIAALHPMQNTASTPATNSQESQTNEPAHGNTSANITANAIANANAAGPAASHPQTEQASLTAAPASATASTSASSSAALQTDKTLAALKRWPPNTRLNYKLGGNYQAELHGTARVLWQRTGVNYQARVELDVGLLLSMQLTSQGRIAGTSLAPGTYEEQIRRTRRTVLLSGENIHLNNGETVARPEAVQDTASQFIELSHRFASGQVPLRVGESIGFPLVRPNNVAAWTYDVVAQTTLYLPRLGATQTWQVKPRPINKPGNNVSAEMWIAPSLQYLPVRIRITFGPDQVIDLLLDTVDQASAD